MPKSYRVTLESTKNDNVYVSTGLKQCREEGFSELWNIDLEEKFSAADPFRMEYKSTIITDLNRDRLTALLQEVITKYKLNITFTHETFGDKHWGGTVVITCIGNVYELCWFFWWIVLLDRMSPLKETISATLEKSDPDDTRAWDTHSDRRNTIECWKLNQLNLTWVELFDKKYGPAVAYKHYRDW